MQLRSTTPILLIAHAIKWIALIATAVTIIVAIFIQSTSNTSAKDTHERTTRIQELTNEIDKTVARNRVLNERTDSISSQITAAQREQQYLEKRLAKNADDLRITKQQIEKSKKVIQSQRKALGQSVVASYIDGSVSPIEMLASSSSVTSFIDRQSLREGLEKNLAESIDKLRTSQKKLQKQRELLVAIAGEQKNQKLALNDHVQEQQSLLGVVNGQSQQLKKVTKKMATERRKLQTEQQQSLVGAMSGAELVTSGSISEPVSEVKKPVEVKKPTVPSKPSAPKKDSSNTSEKKEETKTPAPASKPKPKPKPTPVVLPNGGYPSYLQKCYVDANAFSYGIDPWGYGCRQCVSYAAWKVLQKTGKPAMYWGNAKDWPASAKRAGYKTGSSPKAKSVGVMKSGPYGHVVWVESINKNGTINISQYNYWLAGTSNGGWGWYSEFKNVSPRAYDVYIYV